MKTAKQVMFDAMVQVLRDPMIYMRFTALIRRDMDDLPERDRNLLKSRLIKLQSEIEAVGMCLPDYDEYESEFQSNN